MEVVAVIDFETTGLSPAQGDRATEVAAVIVADGQVVDRYQSLMNAGVSIPPFIEALTGISNAMVRSAPPAAQVMREIANFVGDYPLVAHNASFDSKFWDAELARTTRTRRQDFVCSLLLSRRLLPQAPSHKLGALVEYANLPVAGRYHRALADAEMAASLLLRLTDELRERHQLPHVSVELLRKLQRVPKHQIERCIARERGG
ncbi:3'-5' exonuclease [Denitromonas iodatirespirans]|uniref:3'-5' exonuclease n=1 Tax=Denitromonas iodatirespirans TaxID=2795389 RepID=A0A944HBP3_DENI1|nr:3'-5' exonuclease [Denitromonas iodatirespirans]MBT0961882.1 3'-5' exonuclease [Denitromonas iodatirespirans]